MIRNFNAFAIKIKIEDIFRRVWHVPKENTFAGMTEEPAFTFTRGFDPNPATKSAKFGELGFGVVTKFMRSFGLSGTGEGILNTEKHQESIRPKTSVKIGTGEHRTKGVAKGLMGTFDRAVLMRATGTGGLDVIAKFLEEFAELGVMKQFTTLVNHDIFVGDVKNIVFGKPRTEPVNRSSFRNTADTIQFTGGMISDKQIAGLTVETREVSGTGFVLRLLANKTKINGKALVREGSLASGTRTVNGASLELSGQADGALVENRGGFLEFRDTVNVVVGVV
jgi:hypothetical protein